MPSPNLMAAALTRRTPRAAIVVLGNSLALYNPATGDPIPPAKPELASLEPRGVQRGQTTRIKLSGKNLLGAEQLKFTSRGLKPDGIQVKLLPAEARQPGEVVAEVTPTATLARGTYAFTISTPGGTSPTTEPPWAATSLISRDEM